MEYKPNALCIHQKRRSFHGVEPIGDEEVLRDILLYDIRVYAPAKDSAAENPQAQPSGGLLKRFFGGARK